MVEQLHKEILDSIKEFLRLKWPPMQQEKQWTQLLANNPRPDPHMAFATTNQTAYEEMMTLARDAQHWALVAAAILEEWMESMSHSTSNWCSTSHQHSASCRRSRSLGQQEESSQATPCYRETKARQESSQMTSHKGGTGDINLFEYQRMSCVISHWRGMTQEWTWSPRSTRQKYWVAFTEGRVPSLGKRLRHGVRECPHDTETEMGYQLPPPLWQTKAAPWEMADWSRPWGEAQTTPSE